MTDSQSPRTGGSRQRVLGALRRTNPPPIALPDLGAWTPTYGQALTPQRIDAFASALEEAEAGFVRIESETELGAVLRLHAPFAAARRIVSGLADLPSRGEPPSAQASPHSFADVDVTVARGRMGVAEDGAVWCDGGGLPHRVTYFLCQHLVLVVRADTLVDTLHDAYQRLAEQGTGRGEPAWSGFIAGPSKTADIEQALVVGAHGPRSHLVVLVGS